MNRETRILVGLLAAFGALWFLPTESPRFSGALLEALRLAKWYAREHVLLCLVPAFFIAGAIGTFISQNAVMKYFGPTAPKGMSYSVASVSGTVLAVCSCTVLPLFGSIYYRGAGLGPAIAFLYSGPAINVLAIVLTARILGWELGVARAIGAISFSVVLGLLMHLLFRKEERAKAAQAQKVHMADETAAVRPLWQSALLLLAMAGILVFANWARPQADTGIWAAFFHAKWIATAAFGILLAVGLGLFFRVKAWTIALAAMPAVLLAVTLPGHPVVAFTAATAGLAALTFRGGPELAVWRDQTWGFAKQILPLLFGGVLLAGLLLGGPEGRDTGLVPSAWVQALVGDSPRALLSMLGQSEGTRIPWLETVWPLWTNLFAAAAGALMYFATLTEVPIVRGLLDSGMGQGPALSLLLAGPALSLPSMLVINSILGPRKTLAFVGLVVVLSAVTGMVFGALGA